MLLNYAAKRSTITNKRCSVNERERERESVSKWLPVCCVCVNARVYVVFLSELPKGCARKQGAVYWGRSGMDDETNCTALRSYRNLSTPKKSRTTPPPAAPSHSNYEPRAGRSEYNFLYCVNVRTYVWIRKMFILQKKKAFVHLYCKIQIHFDETSNPAIGTYNIHIGRKVLIHSLNIAELSTKCGSYIVSTRTQVIHVLFKLLVIV